MVILAIICIIVICGWAYTAVSEAYLDIRKFYFLNYVDTYRSNRIPRHSIIRKCVEEGLLSEEDLYIDLTGGDDTCGVSDYMFFMLRMEQNCTNGEQHRSATNLVPENMRFRGKREDDLTGEWVYTVRGFIDADKGWWNTKYVYAIENARGNEGDFYIDRGSGYRVRKEWEYKLKKIFKAVEKYNELEFKRKENSLNEKFSELRKEEK